MNRRVFFARSKILYFVSCCFVIWGCQNYDPPLEKALSLAKNNRQELERVLAFYCKDSLKLEAAKFLIKNMPGHYSYQGNKINRYYDAVDSILQMRHIYPLEVVIDTMEKVSLQLVTRGDMISDVEVVTADYLIENIEDAFGQWENGSWSTHVSFQDFCEYMLPYKVMELQPLDNWRSYLKKRFNANLENLKFCDLYKKSAVWATHCINNNLKDSMNPKLIPYKSHPIFRLDTKLKMPFGVCGDYAEVATAVLRSEGIPVTIDFTPQWPFRAQGHSWNVILANNGKNIPFSGVEENPGEPHKLDEKMAKVYRKTYAINPEVEELQRTEKKVPNTLQSQCIKDVTNEYMVTSDVEVDVSHMAGRYAYLAVFNNESWIPVAFGAVCNHKAVFKDMGRDILYLPVCYVNDRIIPVGEPFILTSKGDINKITPKKEKVQKMRLYRKYPLFPHVQNIAHRIVGGKFQAANSAGFEDAVTFCEVNDWGVKGVEICMPVPKDAYRYWRYYQPNNDSYCNIAEIIFIDQRMHQAIIGKVIGTKGSYGGNPNTCKEVAFDGNILTFFDAPVASGGWVGMDFGHPVAIEKVIYTPRGDGNSICIGDEYELFYWNADRWISLGRQFATNTWLDYKDVPAGALYLLRNLTHGVEERIFLYENAMQEFW